MSRLHLSTKCRQLERQKTKHLKMFRFLQGLNVQGGFPSPLHTPPMRATALLHGFVYSLRRDACRASIPYLRRSCATCLCHPQQCIIAHSFFTSMIREQSVKLLADTLLYISRKQYSPSAGMT